MTKISKFISAMACLAVLMCVFSGCDNSSNITSDSQNSEESSSITQQYTVTFDYNYEGSPSAQTVTVDENGKVEEFMPTRDGYEFDGWYTDISCVQEYDFTSTVNEDFTLYASWLESGVTYYTVTYYVNYEGGQNFTQKVAENSYATRPDSVEREGYELFNWYSDEQCTTTFRFSSRITADTCAYALWGKTEVFEAEYIDFDDLSGPGYSGSATGTDMILRDTTDIGASNGYYVSYLYKKGTTLTFNIVSDEAVSNARLYLRLSAELKDITINGDSYSVYVNDNPIMYEDISFVNVTGTGTSGVTYPFDDYLISSTVSLNEGDNVITLVTNNSDPMGGTMSATAPVVDCIKISSTSSLSWAEGYPIYNK